MKTMGEAAYESLRHPPCEEGLTASALPVLNFEYLSPIPLVRSR